MQVQQIEQQTSGGVGGRDRGLGIRVDMVRVERLRKIQTLLPKPLNAHVDCRWEDQI